ncbi:hypothetical protein KO317_02350 [Candidatus Micrarchaeota archaeon]|nr:hypothetical protein [Candidatus Micrarchaeota archaeon]
MYKKQDLLNLKNQYSRTLEEINEFGEEQFKDILELTKWLEELIEKTERIKKQEEISNQDLRQKFKLGRKLQRAYKTDLSFEATILNAMEEGKISSNIGEKFKEIIELLKKRKIEEVKNKFKYFEEIENLNKKYLTLGQQLKNEKIDLETRINKITLLLNNLIELENINIEHIKLVEKYLDNINKLEEIRKEYIYSLMNLKIKDLIKKIQSEDLFKFDFPFIKLDTLQELENLFNKDTFFSNMDLQELYKYFDYSDQKLAYVYPEVSKFNRVIRKERVWFDKIFNLDKTNFLNLKKNEKMSNDLIEFFKSIECSKEIINEIILYGDSIYSFNEYETYIIKKEELKEYSKNKLEQELVGCQELLSLLNKMESKQKQEGFLQKLKLFFK